VDRFRISIGKFCHESLKCNMQNARTALSHFKSGRPLPRWGENSHVTSSISFGSHIEDWRIYDSYGALFTRNMNFHKYFPSLFFHGITGYWRKAQATRSFIRRIVVSHVSFWIRTHPAISLSIFRCTTSIFSKDACDNGSIANPNKTVGVTT